MGEGPDSGTLRGALEDLAGQPDAELRRARAHAHQAMFGDGDEQPLTVGRYRLLANVGNGGLGSVWAAHDPHLDRTVALKLLRDDTLRRHPRAREQLLAEAAIMARLTHPNVVRVYDLGDAGGELYVAMEYVEGQTLRAWQAEPHDWRAIVEVYRQAGEGLAAAHDEGLVHGDFKPDNVLIGADGRVLVSDFAVAQHVIAAHVAEAEAATLQPGRPIEGTDTLTDSSVSVSVGAGGRSEVALRFVGTPAYMAPEQLDGRPPDARADQFAFCVALWEALLGDRPFAGSTWTQLRAAIRTGPARELERSRRMPTRLLAILRRGLAEDPKQRYPDLDALLVDLRKLASRRRRLALGLATLAFVLTGAAGLSYGLLVGGEPSEAQGCPIRPTADVLRWHPEERQAVIGRLSSSGLGERESAQVLGELDQFAARWEYARAQTCAWMIVEDDDDHSNFHDRAFCMYAGAAAFEASVEVLMAPEAELRLVAQPLAAELPDPSRCVATDAERRRYDDKSPSLDVRRKLARASALQRGQRHAEALALVEELRTAAEAEGHGKVLALIELQRGIVLHSMGRNREALRTLERAQALAEATSALQTELTAAYYCASTAMAIDEDPAEIDAWAERTVLLAEDLNDPAVAFEGRLMRGYAALRAGDGERALTLQSEALAEAEATFGPDAPQLAYAHDYLGATHGELGQVEQAREHKRRAVELLERKFGPGHLDVATLLLTSGKIMLLVGEREEGRALLERSHALLLELLGPAHRRTRIAARTLAGYWFDQGQPAQAEALIDAGDDPDDPDHPDDPIIELARAELACDAGSFEQARAALERLRLALADADDLPLRVAMLDLEGRLALVDPSVTDGAARARIVAEAIDVLAGALTQPRHRVRALTLRVAADVREGIDDPRHREQLDALLREIPGVHADVRARARLALWRAAPNDEAARRAAATALEQAFGPEHPLRSAVESQR